MRAASIGVNPSEYGIEQPAESQHSAGSAGSTRLLHLARNLTRAGATVVFALSAALFAAAVTVHLGGYQMLAVESGSMSPGMPVGSLAITRTVPASTLEVGDVITFHSPQSPSMLITHRVASRSYQQ